MTMTVKSAARWLLPLAIVSATACIFDPAAPPTHSPSIVGTVLGADGSPAPRAPIGLIYGLRPEYWGDWPPDESGDWDCDGPAAVGITFTLPEPSGVTFQILDHDRRTVRSLLQNVLLPAGPHGVTWQFVDDGGALVPNGVYFYKLRIRQSGAVHEEERGYFFLNRTGLDYESCLGPATTTDDQGRFSIPYSLLPLGLEVDLHGGGTATIPDSLWIQASQGDTQARLLIRVEDQATDLPVTLQLN